MFEQTDFNTTKPKRKLNFWWIFIPMLLVLLCLAWGWLNFGTSNEISIGNETKAPAQDDKDYVMPKKESNRLDILLLGIRGKEDLQDGGLLTDTIMLFSMDRKSKQSSLTSIPRDLYVKIYDDKKEKINSAYERLGLEGTKKLFSSITGVYIDNVVVFDFNAFKTLVEELGGIDVTLDKPFKETQQWGYEFSLPAGENHLNGEQALYYARSRFSSNDFDRAERQQKIIFAIRQKVQAKDLITDPGKALALINILKKNIQTDVDIFDIKTLRSLYSQIGSEESIHRYVLNTDNLLYDTKINGAYVLLPRGGDLSELKSFFHGNLAVNASPLPIVNISTSPNTKN
jgi:polyisoprenyl-teichoic acid--peptidoglycan teichoic acid transferase